MQSTTKCSSKRVWRAGALVLALTLAAGLAFDAPAGEPPAGAEQVRELVYSVHADEQKLGTTTVTARGVRTEDGAAIEFSVRTRLRSELFGLTVFSHESDLTMLIDEKGLREFESSEILDDERISSKGQRREGQLALEINVGMTRQSFRLASNEFDFTSAEDPVDRLREPGRPRMFKVFDLERLEIVERTFTWVRDETVDASGNPVDCRVIDVSDKQSKARLWLAKDALHTLIREEGADETGAYRITLDRYPVSSPAAGRGR